MAPRFPDLADRPLSEARVCQYENSSNGEFLIDRHPAGEKVVLVGAGSGPGFKHGPGGGSHAGSGVGRFLPDGPPKLGPRGAVPPDLPKFLSNEGRKNLAEPEFSSRQVSMVLVGGMIPWLREKAHEPAT